MSREMMDALDMLEKEKNISKESLFEAIENSLVTACRNHFGKADNVHVTIDPETCDFHLYADLDLVAHMQDSLDHVSFPAPYLVNMSASIPAIPLRNLKLTLSSFKRFLVSSSNALADLDSDEWRDTIFWALTAFSSAVSCGIRPR